MFGIKLQALYKDTNTNPSRAYRADIDGLRALAVLVVILYHTGIEVFSGGYIGVDVFFVISGYLITSVVLGELEKGRFSFIGFYKRRVARLLPAAAITLTVTTVFGTFYYSPEALADFGKSLIFASVGALNIYLAGGVDYFALEGPTQPLIHFWSLGVEEQFYLVWPLLLVVAAKRHLNVTVFIALTLLVISAFLSIISTYDETRGSYYLIQYRAFELLIGCLVALLAKGNRLPIVSSKQQFYLTTSAVFSLLIPLLLLDEHSKFPGINALFPCIGTAILIAYPSEHKAMHVLRLRFIVMIGLISYPLYLYHQPVIAILDSVASQISPVTKLIIVLSTCIPSAWITYKLVECPIRAEMRGKHSKLLFSTLILTIPILASIGLLLHKTDGLPSRMRLLNPFALDVVEATSRTFHGSLKAGVNISNDDQTSMLFIGDSTMQHYVVPIAKTLNIPLNEIDHASRGGCVLLKNVDYIERNLAISCNEIRKTIYETKKRWDTVFISQNWRSTVDRVRNFPSDADELTRWEPFISATISHFSGLADQIVLIGDHPRIYGSRLLEPTTMIKPESYRDMLGKMKITNMEQLIQSRQFFDKIARKDGILIIHPINIFCNGVCKLHNENWPYFRDSLHLSSAATQFVSKRIELIVSDSELYNMLHPSQQ